MSVAVVGGAAIGLAGSIYASNKAGKAAKKAGKQAAAAEQAELDFAREQWDEWKATYGDIEDQLASYYETLTPTFRITQGLEAHEKEMDRARKNVKETLAQRGIATSGIAAQLEGEMAVASAEERARIRAAAPLEVAKEKLGFLQVGLGQNPANQVANALGSQATTARNIANTTARNAGAASGAMIGSFTDFAQTAFTQWMNRDKDDG